MFFRIQVFEGPGFLRSRFFRIQVFPVQVFQGPDYSWSGPWVWIQVLEVAQNTIIISFFWRK